MPSRPVADAAERLRRSLTHTADEVQRLPVAVLAQVVRRLGGGADRSSLNEGLAVSLQDLDTALAELGTWLAQRHGGAPAAVKAPGFTRHRCGRDIARSVAAVVHHQPNELELARWLASRERVEEVIEASWELVAGLGALWRSSFGPAWDTAFVGTPTAKVSVALWDDIDDLCQDAVRQHRRSRLLDAPPEAEQLRLALALDEAALTRALSSGSWDRYRRDWAGLYPRGPEDLDVAQLLRLWEIRVELRGTAVA